MMLKQLPFAIILSVIFAIIGMNSEVSANAVFIAETLIWCTYFVSSRRNM